MATVGLAQIRVPAGGNSPTIPGDIANAATDIDPHLILHVVDKAERDELYSAAPLHTAVSAENGSLWLKTSALNTWAVIYEPLEAWRPLSLASGFTAGQTDPEIRIDRGQAHLRGRIERTDGVPIAISGVKLATVPTDCIPAQISSFAGGASLTGDPMTGVGRVEIFSPDQDGNALGARGSVVWYSQDGTGVPWVDISGSYWLD